LNTPDTLVYSYQGKVFLRDTISESVRSQILRVFDTSVTTSITYGFLMDERDSQMYRTVTIGYQIWMAQNLNFEVDSSWWVKVYDYSRQDTVNDIAARGALYGRLYSWPAAMNLDDSCSTRYCTEQIQSKHRGICPSGWHIPSENDWSVLIATVELDPRVGKGKAASALKSVNGWTYYSKETSTDIFGFRGLPGGYRVLTPRENFAELGGKGFWWSTVVKAPSWGLGFFFSYLQSNIVFEDKQKSRGHSVRCVKD
jgi:uncharacterized protein (TIGR02145 family)